MQHGCDTANKCEHLQMVRERLSDMKSDTEASTVTLVGSRDANAAARMRRYRQRKKVAVGVTVMDTAALSRLAASLTPAGLAQG
jgi:hypothetical protein